MLRLLYGFGLFFSSTILLLMMLVACCTDLPETAANDLKSQGVNSAFVEFNRSKRNPKCKGYAQSVADIRDWKRASKAGLTQLSQSEYIGRLEESRRQITNK